MRDALYNPGMKPTVFSGRLGLQQRVLPAYRAPFFDALAAVCREGLSIYAGKPLAIEGISTTENLTASRYYPAHNWHFRNPGSSLYLCWQSDLLRWLHDWQPDVLILETNPRYLSTPRALRWMNKRRRPVIGWGLGAPALTGRLSAWRQRSRKKLLAKMDALITYSQQGAGEYIASGFPPERIFVAPNAVVPRPVHSYPKRPEEFAGDSPTVLFVGRLQARKRIDNLLHACAALPEALQPRLQIVGDGSARMEFESLARTVYPRTEFLGARHGAELDSFFMAADLFVLPGTGGLAVQQAMSYGLPVVVAEADGTQENLVGPDNGWLVPAGDVSALSAALTEALSDPARLRAMGIASHRIVSEEVNIENMVLVFVQALEFVMNS